MNVIDLIEKKKQGKTHSKEEINFIVKSLMNGTALDSQISAWLMAVCFKGLTEEETANLTEALASSGKVVDFGELSNLVVDKHSTGGVGDKVTITLIPLLAAAGIPVAKLADRGLGIAAGTVDKLESIPHLNTNLSTETIVNQVKNINAVIASQADDLAPADKKLYSLRNLTGTADSEVLIASSIISKKIASGAANIILDVKYGAGAFMKTPEEAVHLSKLMVNIGKMVNKSVTAIITSMEEPLGRAAGNSLEVIEAIEFLKGRIETGDLALLTYSIASMTLMQLDLYDDKEEAIRYLKDLVHTGKALEKFRELIIAQGGAVEVIDNYDKFDLPSFKVECESKKSGYVQNVNAYHIAQAAKILGTGRDDNSKKIDFSVGIYLNKKSGEYVNKGETLYTIYSNDEDKTKIAQKYCDEAFSINESKPLRNNLIYKIIGNKDEDNNV